MFPLGTLGKILVLFGLILAGIGLLLIWSDKIPWIGRLPGDIYIEKENFTHQVHKFILAHNEKR